MCTVLHVFLGALTALVGPWLEIKICLCFILFVIKLLVHTEQSELAPTSETTFVFLLIKKIAQNSKELGLF